MKDFKLGEVIGLLTRTAPFLIFRFLVYMGIAAGFVVVAGLGSVAGFALASIAGEGAAGGVYGGLAGFGVAGCVLWFLREWLLYMVKAGHIAVLTELLDGNGLPGGARADRSRPEDGSRAFRHLKHALRTRQDYQGYHQGI